MSREGAGTSAAYSDGLNAVGVMTWLLLMNVMLA